MTRKMYTLVTSKRTADQGYYATIREHAYQGGGLTQHWYSNGGTPIPQRKLNLDLSEVAEVQAHADKIRQELQNED